MGINQEIKVDLFMGEVRPNDIYFLCTDGLTNMLTDDQILKEFIDNTDIYKACDRLIKLAKFNGGYDNITIVAVKEVVK